MRFSKLLVVLSAALLISTACKTRTFNSDGSKTDAAQSGSSRNPVLYYAHTKDVNGKIGVCWYKLTTNKDDFKNFGMAVLIRRAGALNSRFIDKDQFNDRFLSRRQYHMDKAADNAAKAPAYDNGKAIGFASGYQAGVEQAIFYIDAKKDNYEYYGSGDYETKKAVERSVRKQLKQAIGNIVDLRMRIPSQPYRTDASFAYPEAFQRGISEGNALGRDTALAEAAGYINHERDTYSDTADAHNPELRRARETAVYNELTNISTTLVGAAAGMIFNVGNPYAIAAVQEQNSANFYGEIFSTAMREERNNNAFSTPTMVRDEITKAIEDTVMELRHSAVLDQNAVCPPASPGIFNSNVAQ